MSSSLSIPAHESGLIRVFTLSLPDAAAEALRNDPKTKTSVLGAQKIDPAHIEVFPVSDLGDMSLKDFLIDGGGAIPRDVAVDRAKLAALEGWVFIVYSSAFDGIAQEIKPVPELTLIGTYPQEGTDWSGHIDLQTPSALPRQDDDATLPKDKPRSDAAISGRIAMLALLVAFFVVGLMIWVGG